MAIDLDRASSFTEAEASQMIRRPTLQLQNLPQRALWSWVLTATLMLPVLLPCICLVEALVPGLTVQAFASRSPVVDGAASGSDTGSGAGTGAARSHCPIAAAKAKRAAPEPTAQSAPRRHEPKLDWAVASRRHRAAAATETVSTQPASTAQPASAQPAKAPACHQAKSATSPSPTTQLARVLPAAAKGGSCCAPKAPVRPAPRPTVNQAGPSCCCDSAPAAPATPATQAVASAIGTQWVDLSLGTVPEEAPPVPNLYARVSDDALTRALAPPAFNRPLRD